MRINVTGNAGAGKSTLAQHIADTLDLPLIHMDSLLWLPDWQKRSPEELRERLLPLLEQDSWVLDGVSQLVRHHADHIIFMDMPRHVCAWRCTKRNWRYLFHSRPGLPENCPEWRIIPTLARIIKKFPANVRPVILNDMTPSDLIVTTDTKSDDIELFIQALQK